MGLVTTSYPARLYTGVGGIVAVAAYMVCLAWALDNAPYNVALFLLALPLVISAAAAIVVRDLQRRSATWSTREVAIRSIGFSVAGGVGLALVIGYAAAYAWAVENASYNTWGGLIVVPIVVAINAVLIVVISRRGKDPWLARVLAAAFALKLVGALGRYYVAYGVYNSGGDSAGYNLYAAYQSLLWRQGMVVWEVGGKAGTQFIELLTTALYVVIGPSTIAGFVVYACFAFWGLYLLYRAFRLAVPVGDHRRYALLLFFLPSLLYWPSSIGKEAWLLLWLGVAALGAAKFFSRAKGALLPLALGLVGLALVRPHVAVLVVCALLAAQLFRPSGPKPTAILSKVMGLAFLGLAAYLATDQAAAFLGVESLSADSVSQSITWAGSQTDQGGSAFITVPLSHPLGIPAAIVTVLFRPFPFEAGNAQLLIQSMEGIFLLGLVIASWSRLRQFRQYARQHTYLWFATFYTLVYIIAFAGFANFGILARQRVLMLPLFLVLLALPRTAADRRRVVAAAHR